jgi:hypothetical protein
MGGTREEIEESKTQ